MGLMLDMKMGRAKQVPLAAAIIQASVIRPDISSALDTPSAKRYNQLTNFRWARTQSPFRGVSRATGRAAMRAAVSRLIKARHKSTHFLAQGWGAVARKLRSMLYGGAPPTDIQFKRAKTKDEFGAVNILSKGTNFVVRIENLIGMVAGRKGANAANYNQALHRYGGPALQKAVDEQAAELTARYWPREQAEFARRFNAVCK
jgi:hypothetical protein